VLDLTIQGDPHVLKTNSASCDEEFKNTFTMHSLTQKAACVLYFSSFWFQYGSHMGYSTSTPSPTRFVKPFFCFQSNLWSFTVCPWNNDWPELNEKTLGPWGAQGIPWPIGMERRSLTFYQLCQKYSKNQIIVFLNLVFIF